MKSGTPQNLDDLCTALILIAGPTPVGVMAMKATLKDYFHNRIGPFALLAKSKTDWSPAEVEDLLVRLSVHLKEEK